jgi:hypothetical protein
MKIVITAKKPVLTTYGRLPANVPVDVADQLAKFLIERGDAVLFETKQAIDRPSEAAGKTEPSSASLAAPASQVTTPSESGSGVVKRGRGRPRKEASLS